MKPGNFARLGLTFAATFILAVPPAHAEIAVSGLEPGGNGVYLMWVEGGRVFRAECDRTSSLRDHDHCQKDLVSAAATRFFPLLAAEYGVGFAYFQREAQEAWIKIQRIDTRLFELVNGETPSEQNPVTQEQVDDARRRVDAASLRIAALRDQIGRLEQALAQNGADPTDLEQLEINRAELIRLEADKAPLESELLRLRQTFVEQRARASDANYRDLVGQRASQLNQFDRAQGELATEIKDMECGQLIASRIQEVGYAWETLCQLRGSTNIPKGDIGGAFARAETEDRTYFGTAPGGQRGLVLEVPRDGRVQAIECAFGFATRQDWEGSIYVYAPGGLSADVRLSLGSSVAAGFRYHADYDNPFSSTFTGGFRSQSGRGSWRFEVHPKWIVVGGGNGEPTLPGRCSVILRNAARP